jgi:hypothetical protein
MNTPLVVDTPEDPEFLKQFARASMLHAHLDNALKMFVRSLDETNIEEALEYIGYQGAAKLRKRVADRAREQLGDGEALTMILDFMKRCEDISERRNDLLHSPIARDVTGRHFVCARAAVTHGLNCLSQQFLKNSQMNPSSWSRR